MIRICVLVLLSIFLIVVAGCSVSFLPGEESGNANAPADSSESITNSIGMKLLNIPAGDFLMGSPDGTIFKDELPQHRVAITKAFYLGRTEVTQGQWKAVMGTEPWTGRIGVQAGDDHPAVYVTHKRAEEFCRRLSAKEARTYRLPTEAEWEYACRAGTTTKYRFGDDEGLLEEYAWYRGNTQHPDPRKQHARGVAQKKPNPYGLYDMHGNVMEWCQDKYDRECYKNHSEQDPVNRDDPDRQRRMVFRSGCFLKDAGALRSAKRDGDVPDYTNIHIGFRVVAE